MSVKSRDVRWVGLGCLLVGVVFLGVWGARVYRTARSLLAHVEEAQGLLASGSPLDADLKHAGRLVHGVRADVVALKRDVGWATKVGPAFCWVPRWGRYWSMPGRCSIWRTR